MLPSWMLALGSGPPPLLMIQPSPLLPSKRVFAAPSAARAPAARPRPSSPATVHPRVIVASRAGVDRTSGESPIATTLSPPTMPDQEPSPMPDRTRRRRESLDDAPRADGVEALLVTSEVNVGYLTGFT